MDKPRLSILDGIVSIFIPIHLSFIFRYSGLRETQGFSIQMAKPRLSILDSQVGQISQLNFPNI